MRKTPVVMGVLSIIFGSIQVLVTGATLASAPFSKQMTAHMGKAFSGLPRREGEPDVGATFDKLGRLTEDLKLYTYLTGFAMLAFAVTLIILGWMLYKRRAQARRYAVAWAAAALAYLPVQIWVHVKIILPKTQAVTAQMLEGMKSDANRVLQGLEGVQSVGTVIFYVVFYTPFPILLLWLIGRESAKNDLAPAV